MRFSPFAVRFFSRSRLFLIWKPPQAKRKSNLPIANLFVDLNLSACAHVTGERADFNRADWKRESAMAAKHKTRYDENDWQF